MTSTSMFHTFQSNARPRVNPHSRKPSPPLLSFTAFGHRSSNHARHAVARRGSVFRHKTTTVCAATTSKPDVIVVGGGLAGLACALTLYKADVSFQLLEASDGLGGRVRTDEVDGFLLDRGFQIFLTAYPEARDMMDYGKLDLRPFYAGALVRSEGEWYRVADPFRHPFDGVLSLVNPIGSVLDKVRVGLLRLRVLTESVESILAKPETTIIDRLKKGEGFTDSMINKFFRPFMGGIFFDNNLQTTSRLLEFVMRMLASGDNALPANGIGQLAQNLADQIPSENIQTGVKVKKCEGGEEPSVRLANGKTLTANKGVVVAVEGPEASNLLGDVLEKSPSKKAEAVGTCCLYFKAKSAPNNGENILYLNGDGTGIVNNCCFPSTVAPSYAPRGETLVSVSTVGTYNNLTDNELEERVRSDISKWFGSLEVAEWTHLRTYRIPFAQPNQTPPTDLSRPVAIGNGLYVCGDHRTTATFDGALKSGRQAAEAILASK